MTTISSTGSAVQSPFEDAAIDEGSAPPGADELVERLDRLAHAQNTSRSELLRRGAAAVIEAAEQIDADRILREAYRRVPQDPALVASACRLDETAPAW